MMHIGKVVLGMLVVSVLSSCSSKQKVTDQVTPQACLAKWHKAGVEGDLDRFRQCFYCPAKEHEDAVGAMFDYMKITMELGNEIEKRFGAKSWDDFSKANGGQGMTPLVPPWRFSDEWSSTRPLKIQDDSAEVVLFPSSHPKLESSTRLVCRDGQWFLDAENMFRNPKDIRAFFVEMRGIMGKTIEACKKPGATIDSVKKSL